MAGLNLYLLGPTRVELDDAYIDVKPRKALALLIYLAVTADRHARDSLATMLWPNSPQSQARHALRSRLSELNQTLGSNWIEADRESVRLRPGSGLDVREFQQCLRTAAADPQTLTRAVTLYRDDFLTGFTLPDCPDFDEWQFFQSESLRLILASALEKLVAILSGQGNYETAVLYARRRLALDPQHEPTHRQLMSLYMHAGQQSAALRQYDFCRRILSSELGISPSPETAVLYSDIQNGKVAGKKRKPRPRHNLPAQTTVFIDRRDELAGIAQLLVDEPGCRLLTLTGPGGIGKTRLALAAATQVLDAFPDGAYFVGLENVSEIDLIIPAVADALDFIGYRPDDLKAQLLHCLQPRKLLLVVDNMEHLLAGAGLLSEILSRAPEVKLLVASRERVYLPEEWCYPVRGLAYPAGNEEAVISLTEYGAIELFIQRARQAIANFAPSTTEIVAIGRICQLVEGWPLALELAASWTRTLSCQEIAAEIERSLDFLATQLQNVPERHRSLRAVFEQTWSRLPAVERTALAKLAAFPGSFGRAEALETAGATLPLLTILVDKSLVSRPAMGQYELKGLLRQFTREKLTASANNHE